MTFLDWIFCALASWQTVETFRHGSIFQPLRRWGNENLGHSNKVIALTAKLVVCPFCLSHWTPWPFLLLCLSDVTLLKLPVYVLSITRLTQLANDVFYSFSRSPDAADETIIIEDLKTANQQK